MLSTPDPDSKSSSGIVGLFKICATPLVASQSEFTCAAGIFKTTAPVAPFTDATGASYVIAPVAPLKEVTPAVPVYLILIKYFKINEALKMLLF